MYKPSTPYPYLLGDTRSHVITSRYRLEPPYASNLIFTFKPIVYIWIDSVPFQVTPRADRIVTWAKDTSTFGQDVFENRSARHRIQWVSRVDLRETTLT